MADETEFPYGEMKSLTRQRADLIWEMAQSEESLSEEDAHLADELIAQNPAFQSTVERARQQKAAGKVKTLAELRAKYKVE